jgi:hypothetical protein
VNRENAGDKEGILLSRSRKKSGSKEKPQEIFRKLKRPISIVMGIPSCSKSIRLEGEPAIPVFGVVFTTDSKRGNGRFRERESLTRRRCTESENSEGWNPKGKS